MILALSTIVTAHLLGYIQTLGLGIGAFVGIEVAGDLFYRFHGGVWCKPLSTRVSSSYQFYLLLNPSGEKKSIMVVSFDKGLREIIFPLSVVFVFVSFITDYLPVSSIGSAFGYTTSSSTTAWTITVYLVAHLLWKFD